jgi:antitoxin FitA
MAPLQSTEEHAMGVNLSIKAVPDDWAERLRQRAERNHRSLQGELMALVERAVNEPAAPFAARAPLAPIRRGTLSVEQTSALLRERRASQPPMPPDLPLAVDIIRADRDSR